MTAEAFLGVRCAGKLTSVAVQQWGGIRAELRQREATGPDSVEINIPEHAMFVIRRQKPVPILWRADSDHPLIGNTNDGHIHFVAAGSHLKSEYTKGYTRSDYLALFIQPSEISRLASDDFDPSTVELRSGWLNEDIFARNLMFSLAREIEQPGPASTLFADRATLLLLSQLVRRETGKAPRVAIGGGLAPYQLKRVTDYIVDRLTDELSLGELADLVGLSAHHFCRVFKQSTGLPPHRWQIKRRVEKAKELMLGTDLSLVEIAAAAGFSDQSHFTTVFRKAVGVTPNAWRRGSRS